MIGKNVILTILLVIPTSIADYQVEQLVIINDQGI